MSDNFDGKKPEEKKNNVQNLIRSWAKSDIQRRADRSRKKLDVLSAERDAGEILERDAKIRAKQRAQLRRKRNRKEAGGDADEVSVYEAKTALKGTENKRTRREGVFHRTARLIKELSDLDKLQETRDFLTCEQETARRNEIFRDAWGPALDVWNQLIDNLWSFMNEFGRDFWEIILFLADLVIKIWFYLGSIFLVLGDVFWDLSFFLEQHKRKLFLWFSGVVSAVTVVAIVVGSVSSFEYSYHGKTLGVARSKQDVYRTIDVIGEKLSDAAGVEVNFDVERDMSFKRIFGFNTDVHSTDDILNTLTYMKDLQADAYAVKIDGKAVVMLESEEKAWALIDRYKNSFAKEASGVEYSSVSFKESVTVEEVQALLGDIWNFDDAYKLLTTGTLDDLKDGEEPKPMINVFSKETATYEEEVPYDTEYIENTSLYKDQVEVFIKGEVGKDRVIAEIERENGVEVSRTVVSTTRVSNPINEVCYRGTKPVPESIGTGSFAFPLHDSYILSSYFGERYGIPGVSEVHGGNDYACPIGTHIYASDGGVVVFAGYDSGGYGLMVQIDHGGLIQTIYGHCSELFVSAGDRVYQGQHIANVGSTGVSTGPHLHFEVRYNGVAINPDSVL